MCVWVELYRASTYCQQCLTQKNAVKLQPTGGLHNSQDFPSSLVSSSCENCIGVEPTITLFSGQEEVLGEMFLVLQTFFTGDGDCGVPDIHLSWSDVKIVSAAQCAKSAKDFQLLQETNHRPLPTIGHSCCTAPPPWSASLTPPVLLVEASKQKMIGQIPDSRNCTKPRHFLLSSQYPFSTFRWKKENDYTFESLLVCEKCAGKGAS